MAEAARFPFIPMDDSLGEASSLPVMPITLTYGNRSVNTAGLLDTGSAVNVMPYDFGLQLGAIWDQAATPIYLGGNLAQTDARALIVVAQVGEFPSTRLAFAWAQTNAIPLILGQVNFFLEFDVCFYRSRLSFEVKPKAT